MGSYTAARLYSGLKYLVGDPSGTGFSDLITPIDNAIREISIRLKTSHEQVEKAMTANQRDYTLDTDFGFNGTPFRIIGVWVNSSGDDWDQLKELDSRRAPQFELTASEPDSYSFHASFHATGASYPTAVLRVYPTPTSTSKLRVWAAVIPQSVTENDSSGLPTQMDGLVLLLAARELLTPEGDASALAYFDAEIVEAWGQALDGCSAHAGLSSYGEGQR